MFNNFLLSGKCIVAVGFVDCEHEISDIELLLNYGIHHNLIIIEDVDPDETDFWDLVRKVVELEPNFDGLKFDLCWGDTILPMDTWLNVLTDVCFFASRFFTSTFGLLNWALSI